MSQRKRKSQPSLSQVESQASCSSQQTANPVSVLEEANKLVKYVIQNAGQHTIFRKADFQKNNISKGTRNFEEAIEKSAKILREVYGYSLIVCDAERNVGKSYVVTNCLPYVNYDPAVLHEESDNNKILLLLILAHLFMTNAPVSDTSLFSFLKQMKIDVEVKHPIFGKIKDYITQLVKLRYLGIETDFTTKKVTYTWGIRSEKEISKMEILEFVGKMSGGRKADSWQPQYDIAQAQVLER